MINTRAHKENCHKTFIDRSLHDEKGKSAEKKKTSPFRLGMNETNAATDRIVSARRRRQPQRSVVSTIG